MQHSYLSIEREYSHYITPRNVHHAYKEHLLCTQYTVYLAFIASDKIDSLREFNDTLCIPHHCRMDHLTRRLVT